MDTGMVKMDRRKFTMGMITGVAGAASVLSAESPTKPMGHDQMPTIFVAHGSPQSIDDANWMSKLGKWTDEMQKPKAILMVSAHWVDRPITLGATRSVPLTYDFYGFPKRYYSMKYEAPGAPELARRVKELLAHSDKIASAADRGLDHGAYVPLLGMYPDAEIPVLQISIPTMEPAPLIELGRKLAPLRREGVLIVGSGFLTHNLGTIDFSPSAQTPTWAKEFDLWAAEALRNRNTTDLTRYREKAPGVKMALPTHEHFVPVLVALGASLETTETVTFPITGFTGGSFTQRSVQFG
ncbi:MAG: class III extradiol ring-cleavage dioxygenase [Schlesneria sp.]